PGRRTLDRGVAGTPPRWRLRHGRRRPDRGHATPAGISPRAQLVLRGWQPPGPPGRSHLVESLLDLDLRSRCAVSPALFAALRFLIPGVLGVSRHQSIDRAESVLRMLKLEYSILKDCGEQIRR